MSTRLSGSTKDIINKIYNLKIREIEKQQKKIEEDFDNQTKMKIRNSEEFKNVVEAGKQFKKMIDEVFPQFYLYSTLRDLAKLDNDSNIGYIDRDEFRNYLNNEDEYQRLEDEKHKINKERNTLLFKLENAPIKSDDYKQAYNTLREMLDNYEG